MSAASFHKMNYRISTMILIVSNESEEKRHFLICANILDSFLICIVDDFVHPVIWNFVIIIILSDSVLSMNKMGGP